MGTALANSLPLAVAIALSPFPVIPAILLLFTARPRVTAGSFLVGWGVGVLFAASLFAALSSFIETHEHPPDWASWARLVLGLLLLLYGGKQWAGRQGEKTMPGWMAALGQAGPSQALRYGLLLSAANPKILLLAAAGGREIGGMALPVGSTLGALVVFTAVGSLTVALPWVLYLVGGERVLEPLGRARDWLADNNAAIMAVVLAVIGLMLMQKGLSSLM
ncbi:MAG: GAP family protein [Candidatus Nanopelagicales bacterium]